MAQIGTKLLRLGAREAYPGGIGHWCPGCGIMHAFRTDLTGDKRAIWDGNAAAPSFEPENNIVWGDRRDPKWPFGGGRCRYALIDGTIVFDSECTHELAGQRVSLPDLPGHLL